MVKDPFLHPDEDPEKAKEEIAESHETCQRESKEGNSTQGKKKKKKRNRRKKFVPPKSYLERHPLPYDVSKIINSRGQDNSHIINLGSWREEPWKQTTPPCVPIDLQFPTKNWPEGEYQGYVNEQSYRNNSKEMIQRDEILISEKLNSLRKAAEVHRQVRKYAQTIAKPGIKMIDLCQNLEKVLRNLINAEGLTSGQAFPTGCSLNSCAAHYTPNYGDNTVLKYGDVCKLDFGTHINGWLVDSAFTIAFDPQFQGLLEAVQESTETGIKTAGIDVRLCDVGEAIQETMESHEVEINGKIHQIKCVRNLCGHSIEQYRVHGKHQVPTVKGGPSAKMEEGMLYAIETFGTTGKGYVNDGEDCSHYMKEPECPRVPLRYSASKRLLKLIEKNFGTLAWCKRWVEDLGEKQYHLGLRELVDRGIVNEYPPLYDVSGSFVAQYEHSFLLKPSGKEILSRGDDY